MALMAPSDQFDAGWLATRRWFRSKTRPLKVVALLDQAPLAGDAVLQVLAADFVDGGHERYLVPAMATSAGLREPVDGDGLWRSLVARLADGPVRLAGRHGAFELEPGAALAELLPGGPTEARTLAERALGVEQSNTSVSVGDRLMLKLYRLLEPGINPEVELLEWLTERGFPHAPRAAGTMRYRSDDAEPAAAAVVQSLVPARGDAWTWILERLASPPEGPVEALAAVAQVAGITAELHAALRGQPDRPGFPSRPASADELHRWRTGAEQQLEAAMAALEGEQRAMLAHLAPEVRTVFGEMASATSAWVSRIHGDYHLGQLLRTDAGFVVTDFEGEPARPLAERRQPSSPLRDVAGMLRSLDYAALTAARANASFEPDGWLADARAAFLAAYGDAADRSLLRAFEVEKACYEVRYEANFRPDWVPLPLGAVARLVGQAV
jgi:trehalose synthase-fused probable maltokinase